MSPIYRPIALPTQMTRAMAVAALLGATILASPLNTATAQAAPLQLAQAAATQTQPQTQPPSTTQPVPPTQAATQTQPGATAAEAKAETVEQRIASLHADLQITPQEEPKWDRVAQVMRDNATAMQKLVADRDSKSAANVTAVEDLKQYEKFAQAHVTGLRKLTASFETLYDSMPSGQKKVADQVFQTFGHHNAAAAHS